MEASAGDSESSPKKCTKNEYDHWDDDDDAVLAAAVDNYTCNLLQNEESTVRDKYIHSDEDSRNQLQNDKTTSNQLKTERSAGHQLPNEKLASNQLQDELASHELQNKESVIDEKPTKISTERSKSVGEVAVKVHEALTPLRLFRRSYLCVTDLTKQHWCEQMMLYTFTVPTIPEENPVMTAGSNLHLARELAVHDIVRVEATSKEDVWAIKFLNLLGAVQGFLNGVQLAREIPIFGAPFDKDVFLVGLIDELRFDPDSYTIDLSELKTRTFRSCPKSSQQKQNRLQVMLYKKLFDDLVKGKLSKETVSKHLKLKLDKPFGKDVMAQLDSKFVTGSNLNDLIDFVFMRIQTLTCINQLSIEYVVQDTNESLCQIPVQYDEDELKVIYEHYLKFWQGQRAVEGVEIEDAWKCQRCDFADICEWRERKAQEHSERNRKKTMSSSLT